jgi:hypothetical protein
MNKVNIISKVSLVTDTSDIKHITKYVLVSGFNGTSFTIKTKLNLALLFQVRAARKEIEDIKHNVINHTI